MLSERLYTSFENDLSYWINVTYLPLWRILSCQVVLPVHLSLCQFYRSSAQYRFQFLLLLWPFTPVWVVNWLLLIFIHATVSATFNLSALQSYSYVYVCLLPAGENWFLSVSHCRWSQHCRERWKHRANSDRQRGGGWEDVRWTGTKLHPRVKQQLTSRQIGNTVAEQGFNEA